MRTISDNFYLGDDSSHSIESGSYGLGFVLAENSEAYVRFRFSDDTVYLLESSANIDTDDTDAKLCIFYVGSTLVIKNRLGAIKKLYYEISLDEVTTDTAPTAAADVLTGTGIGDALSDAGLSLTGMTAGVVPYINASEALAESGITWGTEGATVTGGLSVTDGSLSAEGGLNITGITAGNVPYVDDTGAVGDSGISWDGVGGVAQFGGDTQYIAQSTLGADLVAASIVRSLPTPTDASWTGQMIVKVGDFAEPTGRDALQIESDGTKALSTISAMIRLAADGKTYEDLYPAAVSYGFGVSEPDFSVYSGNMMAREFVGSAATVKELFAEFQMSHAREAGSDIVLHLHLYIPDNATGGDIKFSIEYHWDDIGDTGAISTTTISQTITRTAAAGIAKNQILSFPAITGTGKNISSLLSCRIYRDPADVSDTFEASAWLRSFDAHVIIDSLGSDQISSKS